MIWIRCKRTASGCWTDNTGFDRRFAIGAGMSATSSEAIARFNKTYRLKRLCSGISTLLSAGASTLLATAGDIRVVRGVLRHVDWVKLTEAGSVSVSRFMEHRPKAVERTEMGCVLLCGTEGRGALNVVIAVLVVLMMDEEMMKWKRKVERRMERVDMTGCLRPCQTGVGLVRRFWTGRGPGSIGWLSGRQGSTAQAWDSYAQPASQPSN
jgi:hypothetical protein